MNALSPILARDNYLRWARRLDPNSYDPDKDGRPKRKWAIGSLQKRGVIESQHVEASLWYENLIERSHSRAQREADAIQGRWTDAGPLRAACAANAAREARTAVAVYLVAQPSEGPSFAKSMQMFDLAFEGANLTVIARKTGFDRNTVAKRLARSLEALVHHWERETSDDTHNSLCRVA